MYTKIDEYKDTLKSDEQQYDVYIVLEDGTRVDTDISGFKIISNLGQKIIGNFVARRIEFNLFNTNLYNITNKEFEAFVGLKVNGKFNYISLGKFIANKPEVKDEKTDECSITAQDYSLKFKVKYEPVITFPCTVSSAIQQICSHLEIDYKINSFINADYNLEEFFIDEEATFFDVIKTLAETGFANAYIDNSNSLIIKSPKKTSDYSFALNEIFELQKEDNKFGPLNAVVASRVVADDGSTTEDVYARNEASITKNGIYEYKIIQNDAIDYDRQTAVNNMLAGILDFEYVPATTEAVYNPAMEVGDLLEVPDVKTDTSFLLYAKEITADLSSGLMTIESSEETQTETDYKAATVKDKRKKTEYKVNKMEGKITELIQETTEQSEKIVLVEKSLEGVSTRVESTETSIEELKEDSINVVEVQYALSASATEAPTTGWSTEAPEWVQGAYMWQKTVTTYADGTITESNPTNISGAKGDTGKDGTSVTILGSYDTVEDLKLEHQTGNLGDAYIITGNLYVWSPSDSDWLNVGIIQGPKGEQGIPGTNGENGQTSYLHIKYSNDGGKTFTSNNGETVGTYIGQYVDFVQADSTNVSDYKWAEIKGEKGETGAKGDTGPQGDKGDTGIGVKELEAQYYLSTSNTETIGGEWKTEQDTWEAGKYIWTRTKITWTDDTIEYTTPVLADALNSANEKANQAIVTATTKEARQFYLPDSADNNCKKVDIFGESTQETRSGKNILMPINNNAKLVEKVVNGITFTPVFNENGDLLYVNANGTATTTARYYFATESTRQPIKSGSYKLSGSNGGDDTSYRFVLGVTGIKEYYLFDGYINVEIPADNTIYFCIYIYANATINNVKFYPMLSKEGGEYEPYGAMPSPEFPSEIESVSGSAGFKSVGKNLFNYLDCKNLASNGNRSTTRLMSNAIKNTEKLAITVKALPSDIYYSIVTYDDENFSNPTARSWSTELNVIQLDTNKPYIRMWFKKGSAGTTTMTLEDLTGIEIQVEQGAPTEYEAYKESITIIPLLHDMRSLPNGARDRIYHSNGKWYDEQRIYSTILNGTETGWSVAQSGTDNWYYRYRYLPKSVSNYVRSSHYKNASIGTSNTEQGIMLVYNNGELRIRYGAEDTITNFKTWLSENNVEVNYELAEPIVTEITDPETIEALESIRTYKGITNITADAPCILTYYRDVPIVDEYETKQNANKTYKAIKSEFADFTIEQNKIQGIVSETVTKVDEQGNKIGEVETSLNEVTQTAEETKSEVSKKVGKDEIISKINQSAEEVQIDANRISLKRFDY